MPKTEGNLVALIANPWTKTLVVGVFVVVTFYIGVQSMKKSLDDLTVATTANTAAIEKSQYRDAVVLSILSEAHPDLVKIFSGLLEGEKEIP